MPKLYTSHTAVGNCVVKLKKDAYFNLAVVAQDDVKWALSITGGTGFPLVQKQFGTWGIDLENGHHIPHGGTGFWRGKSGFVSEQSALDELLVLLGYQYYY